MLQCDSNTAVYHNLLPEMHLHQSWVKQRMSTDCQDVVKYSRNVKCPPYGKSYKNAGIYGCLHLEIIRLYSFLISAAA